MKICFVCLGNIVRSPLAENIFQHLAEEAGVADVYQVDSAGTSAYHVGESPDSRMRKVARKHGLEYDGRARQFRRKDFDRFDLLIAMSQENRRDLERLAAKPEHRQKIKLMRDYDPQARPGAGVPDPYYGGMEGFERVYQIVERSCRHLLEELERERLS
jgi:protein-tyrosine phosphatase